MRSIPSYILPWISWLLFKPGFQSATAFHTQVNKEQQRQIKSETYKPPKNLHNTAKITESKSASGHTVYTIHPPQDRPPRRHILFIHGGAFVFEMTSLHWKFAADLADQLDALITIPRYPVAPSATILDMYDMLRPLYDQGAKDAVEGLHGGEFIAMGDSAGGCLSLSLTQQALDAGTPTASKLVLISPAVDSSLTNPALEAASKRDPWFALPGLFEIRKLIAPDDTSDGKDPLISPINGRVEGLPPMQIYVAQQDMLGLDAKIFAERARKEGGVEVDVVEGEGMVHAWPLMPFYEGKQAKAQIISWLK